MGRITEDPATGSAAAAAGLSPAEVEAAGRLGATFRKREPVRNEFAEELAARLATPEIRTLLFHRDLGRE